MKHGDHEPDANGSVDIANIAHGAATSIKEGDNHGSCYSENTRKKKESVRSIGPAIILYGNISNLKDHEKTTG